MAEVLIRSQSPVTHQVFWNGDVATPSAPPIVNLYDVTMDPAITPAVSPTHLLTTLTSTADENNLGSYVVNVPYQYTDRNRTLRLRWQYTVEGTAVIKDEDVFVVTSYIDFNHIQDMEFSTDSSDPNYKSYKDLLKAERYARKQIEQYTGQKFYLYDDLYVAYGYDSDTLPLPAKIAEIHELYSNDILLLDTINDVNNWNFPVEVSESGYGIRINKAGLLDNTVYTANGMVPPTVSDSYGIFRSGVAYKVQGRFGWDKVPDNVELATFELMKDYFSKDTVWKNKYVKSISTFDWDFEYTGDAYTGTGNSYADNLLADYVLTIKAELI
jgi:hypothetical protein